MKPELERRVHELLDAGRSPLGDAEVRRATEGDAEVRAEVAALSRLDGWLRDWEPRLDDDDFEAIAERIEQRLDEPIGKLDVLSAPDFDDPDAKVRPFADRSVRSGEYSLEALADAVEEPARAATTGPAPAVTLGAAPARREPVGRGAGPWIAAAAVALLAVVGGLASYQSADEAAPAASAPGAQEAASEPWLPPLPELAPGASDEGLREERLPEAPEEEVAEEPAPARVAAAPAAEPAPADEASAAIPRGTMGASRASEAPRSRTAAASGGALPSRSPVEAEAATADRSEPAAMDQADERGRAAVRACLGGVPNAVVMVSFAGQNVRSARVVRPSVREPVHQCVTQALRRTGVTPEEGHASRTLYFRWGAPPVD